MISKVSDFNLSHINNALDTKQKSTKAESRTSETDSSKIEKLKASIDSGTYKIDIKELATRMADSLM